MDGVAIKAMVAELAPVIREYVDAAQAPLLDRITSLEAEKGQLVARCEALETAEKPEIDLTGVEKLIADEIAKIPSPEPAKEVDREELATLVNEAVAALPLPQDGQSIHIEDVLPAIASEVAKAVEQLPVPTDGKDGLDGRGIKDLLVDRDGHLIATMDDGSTKNLGPIVGKDGDPGKDGEPGFGLDDFDCQPVDERTIKMEFVRGETRHSYELQFPIVVYRGVFKDGDDYERGDMVTWGGSLWHCDTPTKDKPGTDSWTLAAKKGRDGKDAKAA